MVRTVFLFGFLFLAISTEGQDPTWIKSDLQLLADSRVNGRVDPAYLATELSKRRTAGPVTNELVENYRQTALAFDGAGAYEKAYRYIDTTVRILSPLAPNISLTNKARAEHLYGQILYNLKVNDASQYWYDRGLATLRRAMEAGDSLGSNRWRIQTFTTMATQLAAHNQDFARAELVSDDFPALNRRGRAGLPTDYSDFWLQENIMARGFNLQKQERFAEARAVYEEAMTPLFQQYSTTDTDFLATELILRGNYASTYVDAGDYATARPLLTDILSKILPLADESAEIQDRIVITYGYLLNTLQGLGRYEEVNDVLTTAVNMRYRIDSTRKGRNLGLIYAFAAKAAAKQNDFSRADSLFTLARYAFVGNATPIGAAQLPRIAGNQIYGREEFLYFLSEYREAWLMKDAAGRQEGLPNALATARTIDSLVYRGASQLSLLSSVGRFLGLENRHFARGIDIALRLYRRTGEERYLKEAFGFVSRQKSNLLRRYISGQELAESFGVPQDVIGKKITLETAVLVTEQALYAAEENNKSALRTQLLREQQELQELRRRIESDYPAFSHALRGAAAFDPVAAAAELEDNHLVVEYFLSADSVYLFTLSAAKGVQYRVLPRPGELNSLIDGFFTDPTAPARLYDLLVAPALENQNGITRLQFIPDGSLWKIPFAALKQDGEFLIWRFAISYAYSSPLLFNPPPGANPGTSYLGNGISYNDIITSINAAGNRSATASQLRNMGTLPYARKEVLEISKLLGGTARLDSSATRQRFLQEAPGAGILHLAMHGVLKRNPMESALVFRGEGPDAFDLLPMKELLGKNIPTRLTVLSACHSGNGPVETAEGMQTIGLAFTAAGSRATITSNWAAQDAATYEILTETSLALKDGAGSDVALQRGMIAYLKNNTAAKRAPINWAHLSLTGSTTPVFSTAFPWYFWVGLIGASLVFGWILWCFRPQTTQDQLK